MTPYLKNKPSRCCWAATQSALANRANVKDEEVAMQQYWEDHTATLLQFCAKVCFLMHFSKHCCFALFRKEEDMFVCLCVIYSITMWVYSREGTKAGIRSVWKIHL